MPRKVSKSKLLQTALALFSSKGYSETKMSEIAQKAGLSVGALYLRFSSKQELCMELIKDQTKDFCRFMEKLQDMDPVSALKEYIHINLEYAFEKKQMLSMFIREHRLSFIQPLRKNFFKSQHEIIENILIRGCKNRAFRQMDTNQTALMIFACIRGAVLLKIVFRAGNTKTLGSSLYKLIINGIGLACRSGLASIRRSGLARIVGKDAL